MVKTTTLAGLLSLTALTAWATWEAQWQPVPARPITPGRTPPSSLQMPPSPVTPLSDYHATLQRPLFFADRSLPSPEADTHAETGHEHAPATGATARLSLKAVIIEGDQRSALLLQPGKTGSTQVREGEHIAGWRLVSIEEGVVTLESNGTREQLPLRHYGAAAQRPAAAPTRPTGDIGARTRQSDQ